MYKSNLDLNQDRLIHFTGEFLLVVTSHGLSNLSVPEGGQGSLTDGLLPGVTAVPGSVLSPDLRIHLRLSVGVS